MALKHKLDSLDGLDEALKPLYAKGEDGRFTLQVEDAPATNTIAKLKADLDAATKALKDKEAAEAKAQADAERAKLEAKGDYEKLSAADKAALKAAEEKAAALETKLRTGAMERAAMEAIVASGGIPEALMPHITSALEVVPDGDGFKVLVKSDPGKGLGDYVASLKESKPWGFQPTGASGGGASTHQGGAASAHAGFFDPKSPTFNYTKQLELAKADPKAFEALRSQFPQSKQE